MSYVITDRAKELLSKTNIEPNLVLSIDRFPYRSSQERIDYVTIGEDDLYIGNDWAIGNYSDLGGHTYKFSTSVTKVFTEIGDDNLFIDGSWKIGEFGADDSVMPLIALNGTTTNISQQIDTDKSAATSTSTVKIRLVDKDEFVTRFISPGYEIEDILYRDCKLRLGFTEGQYPQDYIDLFIGKITTIESGPGWIDLTIANPDDLKRSEVFPKIDTELTVDAPYYSKVIQDLTYYQNGNFNGVVEIRYLDTLFGDNATVSVSGNLLTVNIDAAATRAKTIQEAVNNNVTVLRLVSAYYTGTNNPIQSAVGVTPLEVSDEIYVTNVTGFLSAVGTIFRTYLRIADEVIEYTGIDAVNNKFTGCVRRSLESLGGNHEIGDSVSSYYKLGDNTVDSSAVELALKLMLSNEREFYIEEVYPLRFYNFGGAENYENAFLIKNIDALREYNIQVGDLVTVSGADNLENIFSGGVVSRLDATDIGTIVYITGASFVAENNTNAVAKFKSQYNVLPDGLQLIPSQVDIKQFLDIRRKHPTAIMNYELFLKDTQKSKDLINVDILLPSAMYPLPRQGRVSCGISAPPLWDGTVRTLDEETVKNPNQLKTTRTVNKNFYNSVIYKYNEDSVEDRMLSGEIVYSQNSINRIPAPTKPYTITARGVRPSAQNLDLIKKNSQRYINRYQYAAESIPVNPDYQTAFTMEVGDSVVFGSPELQMSDSLTGSRAYNPRVFEVINRDFNWKTGDIKLSILDTNYSAQIRYGVWAPSSQVDSGSTTTHIKVLDSYTHPKEKDKWDSYRGKTVRVHSPDYSFDETRRFVRFDSVDEHLMVVNPPLPSAPLAGYRVTCPMYDDLNLNADSFYKAVHPFWNPTLTVVSGSSPTQFDVSAPDAAKLFVGSVLRIHNDDYSIDSVAVVVKVASISGTTITTNNIGFTPAAGQKIEYVGFVSDEGAPYAFV